MCKWINIKCFGAWKWIGKISQQNILFNTLIICICPALTQSKVGFGVKTKKILKCLENYTIGNVGSLLK